MPLNYEANLVHSFFFELVLKVTLPVSSWRVVLSLQKAPFFLSIVDQILRKLVRYFFLLFAARWASVGQCIGQVFCNFNYKSLNLFLHANSTQRRNHRKGALVQRFSWSFWTCFNLKRRARKRFDSYDKKKLVLLTLHRVEYGCLTS